VTDEPLAAALSLDAEPLSAAETEADVQAPLSAALDEVRRRIEAACDQAGRRTGSVTLVAVTKYASPEQVRAAVRLGLGDFGENYVQNLQQRAEQIAGFHADLAANKEGDVAPQVRWHMVGHLQRNKVKVVLPHLTMLQTLDSLRLAEELDATAARVLGEDARVPCLMQVNCSGEGQKSGVAVGAAKHLAEQILELPRIRLMGLMTMAAHGVEQDEARHTFSRCREIFEEIARANIGGEDFRHLSMGMSDDLEAGILEGSTIVRVGSALFGAKPDDEAQA
jgi:pyridoxal phosphate enzyme (YggS family)